MTDFENRLRDELTLQAQEVGPPPAPPELFRRAARRRATKAGLVVASGVFAALAVVTPLVTGGSDPTEQLYLDPTPTAPSPAVSRSAGPSPSPSRSAPSPSAPGSRTSGPARATPDTVAPPTAPPAASPRKASPSRSSRLPAPEPTTTGPTATGSRTPPSAGTRTPTSSPSTPAAAQGPTSPTVVRPRLVQPTNQTTVDLGSRTVVRGAGCPPGAAVRVRIGPLATTSATATATGTFATTVQLPSDAQIGSSPEAGETMLTATCAGQEASALVVLVDPTPGSASPRPTPP